MGSTKFIESPEVQNAVRRATKGRPNKRSSSQRDQQTKQNLLRNLKSVQVQEIRRGLIRDNIHHYDRTDAELYQLQSLLATALLRKRSNFRAASLAGKHATTIVDCFGLKASELSVELEKPVSPTDALTSAIEMAHDKLDDRERQQRGLWPLIQAGEKIAYGTLMDAGVLLWGNRYKRQIQLVTTPAPVAVAS